MSSMQHKQAPYGQPVVEMNFGVGFYQSLALVTLKYVQQQGCLEDAQPACMFCTDYLKKKYHYLIKSSPLHLMSKGLSIQSAFHKVPVEFK